MDNKEGIVHESQLRESEQTDIKAAAGIRSRITVVCAECKRLKLKCDRRSPCSSCVKRETTARCMYSAAAAEKIDVQSLHNRVSALEDSWRAWTNTQPGQTPCMASSSTHPPPPPPSTALIATTSTNEDLASALVGLDDVSSLWATHLGVNLASLSLRPSPESELDDDDDEPESVRHARQTHMSFRTGVTLSLVSLLPPRHIRTHLWNAAQLVLGPHAGLSRRTRTRFERMCSDIQDGKTRKWPLSLLAVGTAGLAIGAQVVSETGLPLPHSPAPSTSASPLPPCPHALYTLSYRSLSPSAQDTDAVLAALLHAARGTLDGRARIKPSVWPDICRAVGVARGMGLGLGVRPGIVVDDVEEWRRRVWWEVYCADLFTSDFIGLPPSIDDSTFSTSLPKSDPTDSPDGDNTDGIAYFVLKCRLAQLIKSHKRRLLDERPLPLESAASMERQVTEFIKDLPLEYRLDMTSSSTPSPLASEDESLLQIQRCELSSLAHSLILKTYYPFLKRGESSTNFATPHHAALACSNAAHSLVIASTTAHQYLPRTRSYSFAQQLFGGAVVAASVAITSPTGMFSQIALKDVRDALGVLRELDMYGHGLGTEGVASEAVRVVEVLVSKAEGAMGMGGSAGVKRKRGEGEGLSVGFELPYVGASVVITDELPEHHEPPPPAPPPALSIPPPSLSIPPPSLSIPSSLITPAQPQPPPQSDLPKRDRETKPTTKVSPYPKIGVRIRNKASKTAIVVKSRAGSERSVGNSPVTSTSGSGMSPPGAGMQNGGMQTGNTLPSNGMSPSNGIPSNGMPASNGMQPPSNGMQPPSAGGMPAPTGIQPGTLAPSNGLAQNTLQPQTTLQQPLPHLLPDQPQPYTEYQYNEPYYNGGYYGGYDYSMGGGEYKDGPTTTEPGQEWYRQQQQQQQQQPQQAGQWNAGFEMPWVAGGAQQGNR